MRKSGILLHPTSLPGRCGIGDFGTWAYRFADFLMEGGQRLWQVLPLGPPGYGNSPYQCFSSMAGNPLLVSLQTLVEQGLLNADDVKPSRAFASTHVDFGAVIPFKTALLRKAAQAFFRRGHSELHREFHQFCTEEASWLDRYAVFAALKEKNGGVAWTHWKHRGKPDSQDVRDQKFVQFEFFRQWRALKKYCNERGIQIIGDLPIFVAHDSADVWGNPELFDLDKDGNPRTIAGVPPDYFSATGQCWGNPLYRWDAMAATGYRWWIDRVRSMMQLVDVIRIDHFRGFEKFYEIPGDATTAVNGRWMEGPGDKLFTAMEKELGRLPFIAEDLGFITAEVHALRDRWGFPGMRVLQFAFGNPSPSDPFKPYNFVRNCVVYTGTHDNETTVGWFHGIGESTLSAENERAERKRALLYMHSDGREVHWDFIRLALASVADIAVFPLQDALGLGSEARMNRPAIAENNWHWRFEEKQLKPELSNKLHLMCELYGRLGV
ncbi:MAG TPA: 4-alpha-glucanotransferase [Acidobacteriota bacterium]|nr:4-alpha-glucanotransferase [Acidobacteriota bacterium]